MLAIVLALSVPTPEAAVAQTLDAWHAAAAKADEAAYFALFHPDGVFVGTDATEVWDRKAFQAYAHPHFVKGKAWTMTPVAAKRRIRVGKGGAIAWFYEPLLHATYGELRGSGVAVWDGSRWLISQYVLSFPVPNDAAKAVIEVIKGG